MPAFKLLYHFRINILLCTAMDYCALQYNFLFLLLLFSALYVKLLILKTLQHFCKHLYIISY